jgi:thiol-disulfide isomerase/thioredoxin
VSSSILFDIFDILEKASPLDEACLVFYEVTHLTKPILMDFYADWCGPCRMQGPIIEALAKEFIDKAEFKKINVDKRATWPRRKGSSWCPHSSWKRMAWS